VLSCPSLPRPQRGALCPRLGVASAPQLPAPGWGGGTGLAELVGCKATHGAGAGYSAHWFPPEREETLRPRGPEVAEAKRGFGPVLQDNLQF